MRIVNSKQFLQGSVPYEDWRAELDPKLRTFAIWGGVSVIVMLAALAMIGNQVSPFIHTILLWANAIGLISFVVLLIGTRGLQTGVAFWHKLALAQIVLGAVDVFVISLAVAASVVAAIVLFFVYVVLPVVLVLFVLGLLFGAR